MSRAFLKGDDSDLPDHSLPERPLGPAPYYVTSHGLDQLRQRFDALLAEHAELKAGDADFDKPRVLAIERDLRYVNARLEGAVLVHTPPSPHDEVLFGAVVGLCDAQGRTTRYHIVGEDEADPALGKISYQSPLARELIGARLGDSVTWQRRAGTVDLEITDITYAAGQ